MITVIKDELSVLEVVRLINQELNRTFNRAVIKQFHKDFFMSTSMSIADSVYDFRRQDSPHGPCGYFNTYGFEDKRMMTRSYTCDAILLIKWPQTSVHTLTARPVFNKAVELGMIGLEVDNKLKSLPIRLFWNSVYHILTH